MEERDGERRHSGKAAEFPNANRMQSTFASQVSKN
jgi:hypothetical protein